MPSRDAISLSAEATSSACARLSSWHGPAMIEIGRSLPNLTDPAETSGAAEMALSKALSSVRRDHAGPRRPDQPTPRDGCYFTAENAVGTSSWLTMLPTICPSASVLARAAIQSGSLWNAVHFLSRSASDSHARR